MSKTHLVPVTVHYTFYIEYETDTDDPVEAAELASEDPDLHHSFPSPGDYRETADAYWDVTTTADDANSIFGWGNPTDTFRRFVKNHGDPTWREDK